MTRDDDETIVDLLKRSRDPLPAQPEALDDTRLLSIAERFDIVRPLGEGGMGQVFLVRDRQIEGREVALKVLRKRYSKNAEFKRLFLREIKTAQKFVSPHVNQVRDTGQLPDGSLFLTMDYVDGESLHARLTRERSLLPRHALEIARQMLIGLGSGHEKGFIHRDVKPHNVMLQRQVAKTDNNPYGVDVCILDFGIAGLGAELAQEGVSGTLAYMSPEQAKGERLDPRSDLFGVGLVLFEMIAGERLIRGKSAEEVGTSLLDVQMDERIAELTDLQKPIKKILMRALQKEREKRFQSASEFVAAIERSKAYKLPTNVPVWAWCVMGALTVVAVTRGSLLAGDNHAELEKERKEHADALMNLNTEQGKLQNENNSQQKSLIAANNDKDEAIRSETRVKQELALATQGWEGQKGQFESEIRRLKSDMEQVEADRDSKGHRIDEKDEDLKNSRAVSAKLQNQVDELNAKLDRLQPEHVRARSLDRILSLQRQNQCEEARKSFIELRERGIFSKEGLEGADFVEALVRSAADFRQFEATGSSAPDVRSYYSASQARERAVKLLPGLASVAESWIGLDEAPPGVRVNNASAVLKDIGERIDAARNGLEALHEAEWQKLRARDPLLDPYLAKAHAELYGCQHLSVVAQLAIDEIQKRAITDGHLNRLALNALDAIPKWSRIAESAGSGLAGLRPCFAVFEYAQRFYDGIEGNEGVLETGLDPALVGSDSRGWAGKLFLAGKILNQGSGFPYVIGDTLIFRRSTQGTSASGLVTFWQEKFGVSGSAAIVPNEWTFTRSIFNAEGDAMQQQESFRLTRRGKAWYLGTDPSPVFDLGADEGSLRVEQADDQVAFDLPAQLGINDLDRQSFLNAWAASDRTCLVWQRGEFEWWVSPIWGLVRHVTHTPEGSIRRDLVYSNRPGR